MRSPALFVLILAFPSVVFAENLHECNGVWTNKGCQAVEKAASGDGSLPAVETKSDSQYKLRSDHAQKERIIEDVRLASVRFNKEHGQVIPGIYALEQYCMRKNITVEACEARASALENRANSSAKLLANIESRKSAYERREKFVEKRKEGPHKVR
ncbi:MAG: hypothetical protein KDD64_11875 [Bdellovibrionales bacterium]|nr:hypothetical protein [Bdellovibrionales bacterium]